MFLQFIHSKKSVFYLVLVETDMVSLDSIPIHIINLPERKDRWKQVLKTLYLSKLPLHNAYRFNAVNGYTLSPSELAQIVSPNALSRLLSQFEYRTKHDQITLGGVGCYLSHIRIWKMLLESDHTHFMILEDDCVLEKDTVQTINNTLSNLPSDFDFLFLGTVISPRKRTFTESLHDGIVKLHTVYGMHAYIISKDAVRKLLHNALPINYQLDSYLSYNNHDLKMYELVPNIASQSGLGVTDIQNSCRSCGELSQVYEIKGDKVVVHYSDVNISAIVVKYLSNIASIALVLALMLIAVSKVSKV
ncbi:glycosyltransferase family 25 protein [bacterium]|nr:glycosyltransferase family 25 protein [bacterium]